MKTGLFAGSFDPFTIGHMSIVRRALPLFDRLIIGIGVNETKQCMMTPMQRKEAIERIFEGDDRVSVMTYSGLTADFARTMGAEYIVKGVRSVRDFEAEREQADINRMLSGVERELSHFGKDVSALLPGNE